MQQSESYTQEEKYPFEEEFKPVTRDLDDPLKFLNEINIYNNRYREGEWIFRGQNNSAWLLIPSVFRNNHIYRVAMEAWTDYCEKHQNAATTQQLLSKPKLHNFVLSRVCAAVEQDRVNSFLVRLDNAGILIPYHSSIHGHAQNQDLSELYEQFDLSSNLYQQTDFGRYHLETEIREIFNSTIKLNFPDDDNEVQISAREQIYSIMLEQRYLDIGFALAQHSGLSTSLLDWTTNPLVASFYAAYMKRAQDLGNTRIVVWAVDATELIRNRLISLVKHPQSYVRNIQAQSGVFTKDIEDWLVYVKFNTFPPSFEKYLKRHIESPSNRKKVWRITLPFNKRLDLLRLLKRSNISLSTLEPTHYHVAEEISEEFEEKNGEDRI